MPPEEIRPEEEHGIGVRHQRGGGVDLRVGVGGGIVVVVDDDLVRRNAQDVFASFRAVVVLADDPAAGGGEITLLAALAVAGVGELRLQLGADGRPVAAEAHVHVVQPRVGCGAAVCGFKQALSERAGIGSASATDAAGVGGNRG